MSKKPGDSFGFQFTVQGASGALTDADTSPTGTMVRNGVDDTGTGTTVTISHVSTGLYKATGTIPAGYVKGDDFQVRINATVAGVASGAPRDYGVLDSRRVGDLNDAPALTDYQQRGVAVTLPANPPAGFLAAASYATAPGWYAAPPTPPTAAAIATAVWTDTTVGDFAAAGSPGKVLVGQLGGAFTTTTSSVYSAPALANAPTGGPGGATAGQVATAVWQDLTAGADFGATGSIGALIKANLDAAVSTRSTYAGGAVASVTAPVTVGTVGDKAGYSLASTGLDAIAVTAPTGPATTFPRMLVQLWRRAFKQSTMTAAQLRTYADDGTTVLTTQALSDDGTTQTQGAA